MSDEPLHTNPETHQIVSESSWLSRFGSGFEFWVSGVGYQVSGSGYQVSGIEFRVSDVGFWAHQMVADSSAISRVSCFGYRVSSFGHLVPGIRRRVSGAPNGIRRRGYLVFFFCVTLKQRKRVSCCEHQASGVGRTKWRRIAGPYPAPDTRYQKPDTRKPETHTPNPVSQSRNAPNRECSLGYLASGVSSAGVRAHQMVADSSAMSSARYPLPETQTQSRNAPDSDRVSSFVYLLSGIRRRGSGAPNSSGQQGHVAVLGRTRSKIYDRTWLFATLWCV